MTTRVESGLALTAFLVALVTDEWIPPQRPESEVMEMTRVLPPVSATASEFLKSSVRCGHEQEREKEVLHGCEEGEAKRSDFPKSCYDRGGVGDEMKKGRVRSGERHADDRDGGGCVQMCER